MTEILCKSYFITEFSASVLFNLYFPIHPQRQSLKTFLFKNIKNKKLFKSDTYYEEREIWLTIFFQNVKSDVAEFHFSANMKAAENV